jgi:hypothetical protein
MRGLAKADRTVRLSPLRPPRNRWGSARPATAQSAGGSRERMGSSRLGPRGCCFHGDRAPAGVPAVGNQLSDPRAPLLIGRLSAREIRIGACRVTGTADLSSASMVHAFKDVMGGAGR